MTLLKDLFNTLRPRQNGLHFADDIFKRVFFNENVWISIKILLKFVPQGPINIIPAMFPIMAWRRPGNKPLSEAMLVSLLMHIYPSLGLNDLIAFFINYTNFLPFRQERATQWGLGMYNSDVSHWGSIGNRTYHSGGHHWDYYSGALSCHKDLFEDQIFLSCRNFT